jgi:hypothetical protein
LTSLGSRVWIMLCPWVSSALQFACPMMRGGTRFDANQARLQFLEERQYIAALELAANHHLTLARRCHAPEKQTSRYRDQLS